MNDTDGINLRIAFERAMVAAHAQGQMAPGVFERRPVLIWTPAVIVQGVL